MGPGVDGSLVDRRQRVPILVQFGAQWVSGYDVIQHAAQSKSSLLMLGEDSEGRGGVPRSKGVELSNAFCRWTGIEGSLHVTQPQVDKPYERMGSRHCSGPRTGQSEE